MQTKNVTKAGIYQGKNNRILAEKFTSRAYFDWKKKASRAEFLSGKGRAEWNFCLEKDEQKGIFVEKRASRVDFFVWKRSKQRGIFCQKKAPEQSTQLKHP